MSLAQDQAQLVSRAGLKRFGQLKDRAVRLPLLGMNAPGRLFLAVDGMSRGPSVLVETRRGSSPTEPPGFGSSQRKDPQFDFAQVKIPILLIPTRTSMGQRLIRQKFQLNRTHRTPVGGPCQGVNVSFWPSSADPIRTVGLPLERGLACRNKRLSLPGCPDCGPHTALVRPLPNLVANLG